MAVSYAVNWNRIIWYFIPRACDITSNEWILGQQFPNERLNELFILQSNKQGFTEIAITFGEGGTCHNIGNGRDRTQSRVLLSTSSVHTAENILWLSQLLPFFSIKKWKKKKLRKLSSSCNVSRKPCTTLCYICGLWSFPLHSQLPKMLTVWSRIGVLCCLNYMKQAILDSQPRSRCFLNRRLYVLIS